MEYQTYEPGDELNSIVKCYWTLESPREDIPTRQTIVPDGCVEMIFHYGDVYKQYTLNDTSIIQPRCFVIGQLTVPLEIEPTGVTGIFSVRFHPEGFTPLTTFPIQHIENTAVALEHLFGHKGIDIENKILNATSTNERIRFIEQFLISQFTQSNTIDQIVKSTVETILTGNGQLSIDTLSKHLQINRRQLERKFSTAIGLSPKQLSKTIRLQATLKMLLNHQYTSLSAVAQEGEYYDQAHFIKDFKDFTGLTPKEFYGDNLKMSSLFIGKD